MIQLVFSMVLLAVAISADRLDNIYLPPSNSRTAGGSGNILIAPYNQRSSIPSQPNSYYGTPQQPAIKSYSTQQNQPQIAILRLNNNNNGDGTYQFDFETENRISQQESGQLKNAGTDQESNVVQGSYSYVGLDGKTYTVNYIADELGFRATGDHLPTAPPVPEEILKSLEQNAAEEARGVVDNGQYRSGENIGYGAAGRQYLAPKVQGYQPQKPQNGYRY